MNVNINISPEVEEALRRRAEAASQDVETFLAHIIAEEVADDQAAAGQAEHSHEEFMARIHRLIELHGVRQSEFDDSRESIYSGRGE